MSYKWNHIIFNPFVSGFFNLPYVFKVYPYCSRISTLILFYVWVIVHCLDIPHFIYSFTCADKIFGLFPTFGYHERCCYKHSCISFCTDIYFHFGVYTQPQWNTGHMVTLCLIIWGTARVFSTVVAPFYTPTKSVWGFQMLHILTNTNLSNFLIIAILVVLYCGFGLHFLDD